MRPPSTADAPIYLVYNAAAGRGQASGAHAAAARGCAAAGRDLHAFAISRHDPPAAQARAAVTAAQRTGGIVVAAGCDGTINAVAQAVLGSGCAFGVLPQGTFNYFARTHGIPAEAEDAVQLVLTGHPVAVQAGRVNDRVFLVNASMGLYARLLEERESFSSQYGRSRLVALGAAFMTLLRRHRPWSLRLTSHGEESVVRITSLFVGNNALQFEQVGVAEGDALDRGALAAVMVKPRGLLSQIALLVHGARGRLDDGEAVETLSFQALTVESARRSRRQRIKVAADGEIAWMPMPLVFSVAPEPLWLIKPAPPPAATPAA